MPAAARIVDPFCGYGTVLAVAEAMGIDSVGVELSSMHAKKARNLVLTAEVLAKAGRWRRGE